MEPKDWTEEQRATFDKRAVPFVGRIVPDDTAMILAVCTTAMAYAIVNGDDKGSQDIDDFVKRLGQDTEGLYELWRDRVLNKGFQMVLDSF